MLLPGFPFIDNLIITFCTMYFFFFVFDVITIAIKTKGDTVFFVFIFIFLFIFFFIFKNILAYVQVHNNKLTKLNKSKSEKDVTQSLQIAS